MHNMGLKKTDRKLIEIRDANGKPHGRIELSKTTTGELVQWRYKIILNDGTERASLNYYNNFDSLKKVLYDDLTIALKYSSSKKDDKMQQALKQPTSVNTGKIMDIHVIYNDGTTAYVDSIELDDLISNRKILMFQRSEGWATIGLDPVRIASNLRQYEGIERRVNKKIH